MQISALERFMEIAEAGSYYQAEKNGGQISAQAYSKLVSSLEQELGVRIVKTSRKGIELTPEGSVFLDFARTTVESYAKLQDRFINAHHPTRSKPVVVYATFYAAAVVSELIPQGLIPNDIQVSEEPFDALVKHASSLRDNEIALADLQEGHGPEVLRNNGVSFKSLVECKPMLVVSRNSDLAALGRALTISDMWNTRIVCNSHPEMQHKYRKILSALPKEAQIVRMSSVRGIWEYLKMNPDCAFLGDSVQAILTPGVKERFGAEFVFIPLEASYYTPTKLGILSPKQKRRPPEAARFVRTISDAFATLTQQYSNPAD